jgi:Protein of unknown function (DUF1553)/Protein of unknown function (DUF1549)/Planctomycete cytochrome C
MVSKTKRVLLVFGLWGSWNLPQLVLSAQLSPQDVEFFEKKIRPVLVDHCYLCHSSSSPQVQGGLLLDSRDGLLKGGKSGPALVPEEPDQSLLIKAVRYTEKDLKMPPSGKLPAETIADFELWVEKGAPDPRKPVAVASLPEKPAYDFAEERKFWSYRLPCRPSLPKTKTSGWSKNWIDAFVLEKLEEKNLTPGTPADKRTLIRRATFDLTGLPPTPQEIDSFLQDASPNAFGRVIDRLLASPRYGERWGRFWLDLVRYADTAGDSADYPVPQAYLYRNYVIDSFNHDKPFDQFVREQVAGDLLPSQSEVQRWQQIVATGYLAIARRFSVVPEEYKHLTIDDTLDNLGRSILGLSVSCARCHDHKYDPIPTADYYALYGIFDSTRYPFAGSENIQQQKDFVLRMSSAEAEKILKPYSDQLVPLDAELKRLKDEKKALEKGTPETEGADAAGPGKRTLKEVKAEIEALKQRRLPIAAQMPILEAAYAVADEEPHNARIQRRGDPKNLGDEVPRRFLQVLGGQELLPAEKGSGRLELAEWLAAPENPLTARVLVNRVWQHHFGKGLVSTPSDFGKRGSPPTHPELLDALTVRFMQSGWSIKAMHKLIMMSQTYQLSSDGDLGNLPRDPGNDFLWKFNRQRLDAETIRDSLLMISGQLDLSQTGAHPFPHASAWSFTQHNPFTAVYDTNRRSVYLMTQRFQRHPYLSIFDGADPNTSTPLRSSTITPIQALFMMNSPFVHEQADHLAGRLIATQSESQKRIDMAYQLVLGRSPSPEELHRSQAYLQQTEEKLKSIEVPAESHQQKAWASYAGVLLSSNEFIFVE